MAEWCWPPPVSAEVGTDAEVLQVYQDQNTIVEPGLRWIKSPRGDQPRVAGETRTDRSVSNADGLGLLVYSIIQRPVRLYLCTHEQQLPGNKGASATPTAVVVWTLFT